MRQMQPDETALPIDHVRGAMKAIEGITAILMDVEGAGPERVFEAGIHPAVGDAIRFEFRLAFDHEIPRRPSRPLTLVGDDGAARPSKAFAVSIECCVKITKSVINHSLR